MEKRQGMRKKKEMEEGAAEGTTAEEQEDGLGGTGCTCTKSSVYPGLAPVLGKVERGGRKERKLC